MADLPYKIVVGLEVHVQLLTKTKLFCGCLNKFGLPPNSATCPVCLGMPGVLPVMNRQAYELALKAALALNCGIARFTKWDRKNYYYPDLPKNYQISQYDLPMSHDGWLEINASADPKKEYLPKRIGIIRAHLEEDAGKSLHDETGGGADSRVDLNRTGTPLLEIVSKPEISSGEECVAYLTELRLMLRELGVSDCEMQEGSLRCDANVNIHIPLASLSAPGQGADPSSPLSAPGQGADPSSPLSPLGRGAGGEGFVATPLVEVKNLNSIRAVERAVKYEADRQFKAFNDPSDKENYQKKFGDVPKATAGWIDERGVTRVQRRKEEASDYRYFPEPDLVPVEVDDAWLNKVKAGMGELPAQQRQRLQSNYGLSIYDANVLTSQGRAVVAYYEETAKLCGDNKESANWVTNQVLAVLNERNQSINDFSMRPSGLADLIKEKNSAGLNAQRARDVFAKMLETGKSAAATISDLGFKAVTDEATLRDLIRQGIEKNPKAVADFKKGNAKAADAIKGFVMKATNKMAKMDLVTKLLEEEMAKV
jgi:aspartyl-tRNA(Asn)/glutamyl-tRNA(Gln) amidotransferase subunit B